MTRVAVIDDWQGIAVASADWSQLDAEIRFFRDPLPSIDAAVAALAGCEVIVPMRERMRFPAALIDRLPALRLLALTGFGIGHIDVATCAARGIVMAESGSLSAAPTAELAIGLMIAASRHLALADREVRAGRFQRDVPPGRTLAGRTLGVVGLGRIGSHVARIARAIGMEVLAWSPHLTAARAEAAGAAFAASLSDLLARADIVSLHVPLADTSRGLIGAAEISAMRPGALLVNTARAGLVDTDALIAAAAAGRIAAALDVFDDEPLGAGAAIAATPNILLSPHLGFCVAETLETFYRQSVENIAAWMAGAPIRVVAPPQPETAA